MLVFLIAAFNKQTEYLNTFTTLQQLARKQHEHIENCIFYIIFRFCLVISSLQ